jgi:hypothetical protein
LVELSFLWLSLGSQSRHTHDRLRLANAPPTAKTLNFYRRQYVSWRRQGLVRPFYARKQAPKSSLWLLPTATAPYVVKEYSGARKQVRDLCVWLLHHKLAF